LGEIPRLKAAPYENSRERDGIAGLDSGGLDTIPTELTYMKPVMKQHAAKGAVDWEGSTSIIKYCHKDTV